MSLSRRSFLHATACAAPFIWTRRYAHAESLNVQIGRMLMANFTGITAGPESPIARLIQRDRLGGVLLLENNFSGAVHPKASLKRLCSDLQSLSNSPVLIAMDQEGGLVNRLKPKYGFPPTWSAQELGAQNDPQRTHDAADTIARSLAELGINFNFAPVVDIRLNPTNPVVGRTQRCFGERADTVVRHAAAFVRAHRQHRIITTLKHFPGHGSSASDSHHGLTDVTATWREIELQPYRQLIKAGLADAVMTAHIFNRNWDERHPASLSRAVVQSTLRQTLGFDGVVISDDLLMGAIREFYTLEESVLLAINAGVDILLFTTIANDLIPNVQQIIRDHVRAGRISRVRIAEANRRIQRVTNRLRI